MDLACNDPAAWLVQAAQVSDTLDLASEALKSDDPEIVRFRGTEVARRIADNVGGRVLFQIGCRPGPVVGSPLSFGVFQPEASRLIASFEVFNSALWPVDERPPESPLWFNEVEPYHYAGLRDDEVNQAAIDLALIGSNAMRFDVNPELLTELTGEKAVNLGLPRGQAEISSLWLRDVLDYVRPTRVVWGVSPADLVATCGLTRRADVYREAVELRERLFEGLSWRPRGRTPDLMLGPIGSDFYEDTTSWIRGNQQYVPDTRGLRITSDIEDTAYDEDFVLYGEQLRLSLDCPERFALHLEQIRLLVRNDIPVVLVGLPTSEEFLDLTPEGADRVMENFQREVQDLVDAGADYVDLTDGWERADFLRADALREGPRDELTQRLAEQL